MKLIFIHGRDQQGKDKTELLKLWKDSLDVGLDNAHLSKLKEVEIAFPYYGDDLESLVHEVGAPLVANVVEKGLSPYNKLEQFQSSLFVELANNAGIGSTEIDQFYAGVAQEKGPLNWKWVHAILRALDQTSLGESAIDTFTRDVYVYLTNRAVEKCINKIVAATIGSDPCVVVGHSLGSIIAYRVLSELGDSVNVHRFITIGSPLGLNAIRNLITPPVLAMPKGVVNWFNAYDTRDVVALRALDQTNWDIVPRIANISEIDNHTDNRHGINGYLDSPVIAKLIYQGLNQG